MNIFIRLLRLILFPIRFIFFFSAIFWICIFIENYEEARLTINKMWISLWKR
jgi:hypothetical protein